MKTPGLCVSGRWVIVFLVRCEKNFEFPNGHFFRRLTVHLDFQRTKEAINGNGKAKTRCVFTWAVFAVVHR